DLVRCGPDTLVWAGTGRTACATSLGDPHVLREGLQFELRSACIGFAGELDAHAEYRPLIGGGPLDVRGGETAFDQLRRERLGGFLIGGREELGVNGLCVGACFS